MNPWIAGALIGLAAAAVAEGIILNGRAKRFLDYAEQLLNVSAEKTAAMPSKSAVRDEPSTEPIEAVTPTPAADEWRSQFNFKPGDAA